MQKKTNNVDILCQLVLCCNWTFLWLTCQAAAEKEAAAKVAAANAEAGKEVAAKAAAEKEAADKAVADRLIQNAMCRAIATPDIVASPVDVTSLPWQERLQTEWETERAERERQLQVERAGIRRESRTPQYPDPLGLYDDGDGGGSAIS